MYLKSGARGLQRFAFLKYVTIATETRNAS